MKLLSHYRSATNKHFSNWSEYDINENMIYSHRSTQYNRETYPVGLHFHDYYELLIVEGGDVRYICESASYLPRYGDVILIPPGKLHMSMINAESTTYSRCVFYLYDNAFDAIGCSPLLDFLHRHESSGQFFTSLKPRRMEELTALLARRLALAGEIGRYKAAQGLPVLDEAREKEVLARRGDLLPQRRQQVERLFRLLMAESREEQERHA